MEKIKIIDLLNKIANGEPVKKFKYNGVTYCYTGFEKDLYRSEINEYDFDIDINSFCLNSQVEIIEEDNKIEELDNYWVMEDNYQDSIKYINRNFENMYNKINEIIDYINKEK